jgi:hypothetical protein
MNASRSVLQHFAHSHDPQFFSLDGVLELGNQVYQGRAAIAAGLGDLFSAGLSEQSIEVHRVALDTQQACGIVQLTLRGRHTGRLLGTPPSFAHVVLPVVGVYQLRGNEISSGRVYLDSSALCRG